MREVADIMIYITDDMLDRFIKEDVPYIDLTTQVLDVSGKRGRIEYICRDEAVVCGTEEVQRILGKLNIETIQYVPSGVMVKPQTVIISGEGSAKDLLMAWKVGQNILEYVSGIATRTRRMLQLAREVNPRIEVNTTRKSFPGTKEFSIKGVVAGGGLPHRLGLSETVLVFPQHMRFIDGLEGLLAKMSHIRSRCREKKVLVEVETIADAVRVCQAGADGVQVDKMPPAELKKAVEAIRALDPGIIILAAGGIKESNVQEYTGTGVDVIVTSAVYFGRPVDIGVGIKPI